MAPQTLSAAPDGETTATIATRVADAHAVQRTRQGLGNALLAGQALDEHCALDAAATQFLHTAAARLGWSARSFHRVLRVARTIADLGGEAQIASVHLAEAVQLRRALPGD